MDFSPSRRNAIQLRGSTLPPGSEDTGVAGGTSMAGGTSEAGETTQGNTEDKNACESTCVPLAGKVYTVLSDSPEGYYIVTCVNVKKGTFTGKYLLSVSSSDPAIECFRETSNRDTFYFETVVEEILSAEHFRRDSLKCISLLKEELNDIILTVAEIDDD